MTEPQAHADAAAQAGGGHQGTTGHVAPVGLYVAVFATLIFMTGLTVAVAFLDLGPFNTVAAMGIAVFKASLVALYFMHLRWSPKLNGLAMMAALACLALLVLVTLSDTLSRGWMGGPPG
ncbi:MAG TPA: cytochrome C oxidase subunit IV family protein [Candidatus Saccharimonadales bacterium]|nr:cytochrome C oxidase subunit IV family protein [Candidatus Saccharimonadales bacterium]